MKILMVNKFLYPKGGAETYVLKLGDELTRLGHEVQYFGMDHPKRIVGNRVGAYASEMDFHGGSFLSKLSYLFAVVYSSESRKKIRRVLEDFQPDVCHLNNFNYQLTPSIILEIRKWEKHTGHPCRIIYTAHDPQLVCPNHMCMNPASHQICEKCLHGSYWNCTKGKCIHNSFPRSLLGTFESVLWHRCGVYKELDVIVCCSHFMKKLLDTDTVLKRKTVVMHNFIEKEQPRQIRKKAYILYFGRYSLEKGIGTLVQAAKRLPEIPFVFAGAGPLEKQLEDVPNIRNVGFQQGEALKQLIREARFSVIPSEWYENCPFSVLESISLGTPVLGAEIGGIPELIHDAGDLFEAGNEDQLVNKLRELWTDSGKRSCCEKACSNNRYDTAYDYSCKLLQYYRQKDKEIHGSKGKRNCSNLSG